MNKESQALDYFKQALSIYDTVLPSNHPFIIKLLTAYSKLLLKLNRNDEANSLLDRLNRFNLSD